MPQSSQPKRDMPLSIVPGRNSILEQHNPIGEDNFVVIKETVCELNTNTWISSLIIRSIQNARFDISDLKCLGGIDFGLKKIAYDICDYAYWECERNNITLDGCENLKTFGKKFLKNSSDISRDCNDKMDSVKWDVHRGILTEANSRPVVYMPGSFLGYEDMKVIFDEKRPREFICGLHRLGSYKQEDPRYYIHMIYRYYFSDLHAKLLIKRKVIRNPCVMKVMDLIHGVYSVGSHTESNFIEFARKSMNRNVTVSTLPVPSKEEKFKVVTDYNFELIPWVPSLRRKIYDSFAEWIKDDSIAYLDIYPPSYITGHPGNIELSLISEEYERMVKDRKIIESLSEESIDYISNMLITKKGLSQIHDKYMNHKFKPGPNQYMDRAHFFLNPQVRNLFHIGEKSTKSQIYFGMKAVFELDGEIDCIMEPYLKGPKNITIRRVDIELLNCFNSEMERVFSIMDSVSRMEKSWVLKSKYPTPLEYIRESISGIV